MNIMTALDRDYLHHQFQNAIYRKDATEFQSFFEEVMKAAFGGDFTIIVPLGRQGDGGNDGYRPKEGIYYQVYSPKDPSDKGAKAATKLKNDFKNLLKHWSKISPIKAYYFSYNNKYSGSNIEIEQEISDLSKEYPGVKFGIFGPLELEEIFFTLDEDKIKTLGFTTDLTRAVNVVKENLDKLDVELDRDNASFVVKSLENMSDIVGNLDNEDIQINYELMYARALGKVERVDEEKTKYESLIKRFPDDPRPYLYLAEIYLHRDDLAKNKELLTLAESKDPDNWLLQLEQLIRISVNGDPVDLTHVDPKNFPTDARVKSNFYRVYSGLYDRNGDFSKADQFIERAIFLNPTRFSNYDAKLSILSRRLVTSTNELEQSKISNEILSIVEDLQSGNLWNHIGERSRALIYFRKFIALKAKQDPNGGVAQAKLLFESAITCYFDVLIEALFIEVLSFVELTQVDLNRLLDRISSVKNPISKDLVNRLIFQFMLKDTLFTEGRTFFSTLKNQAALGFINNIEAENSSEIIKYIADDHMFAVEVATTAKSKIVRGALIKNMPDDGSVKKDKLLLLLSSDEGDMDTAFDLLKKMDLSQMPYYESREVLKVAEAKKAWDFAIVLIENLLRYEKDVNSIINLKLRLFTANSNLERYPEAYKIGEEILSDPDELKLLSSHNQEALLGQTLVARLKHGDFVPAEKLMESHDSLFKSFEYILDIKAEVYIKNEHAEKALDAIVDGIKLIRTPSPKQYGYLFFKFLVIPHLMKLTLDPLSEVKDGTFVKLRDQDTWYYLGDGNSLDATQITKTDDQYKLFKGKKIGQDVEFTNKYSSKNSVFEVENILTIEKYIYWQSQYNANKLTVEKRWKAMELIEIPSTADGIDPKYIISRLQDQEIAKGNFFESYADHNLPLAFLAVNQGGLAKAMGKIVNERRGYVKFSSGSVEDIRNQSEVAKKIIQGAEVYLDGTSAVVLSETGLLSEIYQYLPNLKVPQSVISLLLKTNDELRLSPGQGGYLGYARGGLTMSPVDIERRNRVVNNLDKTIGLLESNPDKTRIISSVNKENVASEQSVDPGLCDACIFAQQDKAYVLTDDFLYLQANKIQTKKPIPEFCSSFALIRLLFEQGKISLDKYLAFFSYLSNYRYRFLPVSVEDIVKAVFGNKAIKVFTPQNIQLLHFELTLSEDYGVTLETAFSVVGQFLIMMLVDDSITPEMVDKIFVEVIDTLPDSIDKRLFGDTLLELSVKAINRAQRRLVVGTNIQKKVDSMYKLIELYERKKIIAPKKGLILS